MIPKVYLTNISRAPLKAHHYSGTEDISVHTSDSRPGLCEATHSEEGMQLVYVCVRVSSDSDKGKTKRKGDKESRL